MDYRREIDGLRAIAVLPVILFHAGFQAVSGGFVGVDVFFVISGYLITTIILAEIRLGKFSIINFYERRARRILPALFFVMGICSVFAYAWMLPDELENFGQSLFATALFSNNILLTLTSGYWALASEFKPLLHTWSLAVEEQYYILFPLLLISGWRFFKQSLLFVISCLFLLSLALAQWGNAHNPDAVFYLLPTRGWELLMGSLVALYLSKIDGPMPHLVSSQILSVVGLGLILGAVFFFSRLTPMPSLYTLIPTVGAVLIILYAREGTIVERLLSSRLMVGVGLVSYSAYLWHWPLFAFARIYSTESPSPAVVSFLCIVTLILAFLSWRYIETPFRNKDRCSRIFVFWGSLLVSLYFVFFGLFLHKTHGVPSRMYSGELVLGEDMYINYNSRVFTYKRDSFSADDRIKLLIVGNSFGRDFVNMTIENLNLNNVELIYRDDFGECLASISNATMRNLFRGANVIVFANGAPKPDCVRGDIMIAKEANKMIFYSGTKHFGYNLNWLVRLSADERADRFNVLPLEVAESEKRFLSTIPPENAISLLAPIVKNGYVPITDELGLLISPDRTHLTKQGAQYIGKRALVNSAYEKYFQDQ